MKKRDSKNETKRTGATMMRENSDSAGADGANGADSEKEARRAAIFRLLVSWDWWMLLGRSKVQVETMRLCLRYPCLEIEMFVRCGGVLANRQSMIKLFKIVVKVVLDQPRRNRKPFLERVH